VNFLYEHGGRRIQEASWCGISFADPDWKLLLLMPLSTLFFFVIPMALILVLYLNIALALRRSGSLRRCASSEAGNSCEAERSQVQCRRMVVRMLVAVVIVFFLCWAPFHAQRLLFTYGTVWDNWTSETLRTVNEWIFYVAGVLYYFNSAINPVLYNVMSKRFRVAFRENLCCRRRRRPARRASNKLLVVFRQSGSSERGGGGSLAELPPPPPPPEPPGVQLCCVQCRGAGSPRSRSEPAHARSQAELGCGGCSRHRHGLSKSEGNCPSSWSPVLASSEWRSSRARREPTELTAAAAAEDDWPPERVCVLLENGTHYQRVPLEASI
ncbi:neuromedin-U receptor 1-like, partial [Amphibalanus amphitrite]|uniref:neuromedin-U receptor 1-like n=1 Tax=Amphibalanus amphitrite TaxID=1232801 RepID=UPI001C90B643